MGTRSCSSIPIADLIGCYETVRAMPATRWVAASSGWPRRTRWTARAHYYAVRDERFNPPACGAAAARRAHRLHPRARGDADLPEPDGLQRPVPCERERAPSTCRPGRYARPRIFEPDHVFAISRILARRGLSIALAAFDRVLKRAQAAISSTSIRRMPRCHRRRGSRRIPRSPSPLPTTGGSETSPRRWPVAGAT